MTREEMQKAKVGDMALIKCGGKAPVEEVTPNNISIGGFLYSHKECGLFWLHKESPFDIIGFEPAPFDWFDVKPGMGFTRSKIDDVVHYIGEHLLDKRYVVIKMPDNSKPTYDTCFKGNLTRSPEHDIEVKS